MTVEIVKSLKERLSLARSEKERPYNFSEDDMKTIDFLVDSKVYKLIGLIV